MVPNMVAMVNFANVRHSPFSGVQRLAHEIGQDALFPTERFITNMERNIDGPSSLCGSAQSTNTLPHSMAGTTRASALTSQPPRYTVHGKGVLTPPARKVNNDDVRLRQTPFHAPFWNSKPTLPVGCWDPMLEPNAGTQCWMFAQCDFPIRHAHQAEWRVVSRNPSSVRWILARTRHAASRTSSHVGTLPCSLLSAIPISPGGNPQNGLLGRPCGTGR